jgi:hypothetical protein
MSEGEDIVALWLGTENIPFIREWRFHPYRRWRFDFALGHNDFSDEAYHRLHVNTRKLAVEVEGHFRGRHRSWSEVSSDYEKFNSAVLLNWRVLRFSTEMIKRGDAWPVIKEAWAQ